MNNSTTEKTGLLYNLGWADEVEVCRHLTSARSKRLAGYLSRRADNRTNTVARSGKLTARDLAGFNASNLTTARKPLIDHGWLVPAGFIQTDGKPVPRYRLVLPPCDCGYHAWSKGVVIHGEEISSQETTGYNSSSEAVVSHSEEISGNSDEITSHSEEISTRITSHTDDITSHSDYSLVTVNNILTKNNTNLDTNLDTNQDIEGASKEHHATAGDADELTTQPEETTMPACAKCNTEIDHLPMHCTRHVGFCGYCANGAPHKWCLGAVNPEWEIQKVEEDGRMEDGSTSRLPELPAPADSLIDDVDTELEELPADARFTVGSPSVKFDKAPLSPEKKTVPTWRGELLSDINRPPPGNRTNPFTKTCACDTWHEPGCQSFVRAVGA